MRYEFGGLFSEFYSIMLFYKVKKFLASSVQVVRSGKSDGELSDDKTETKLMEVNIPNQFPSISLAPTRPYAQFSFSRRSTNTLTP